MMQEVRARTGECLGQRYGTGELLEFCVNEPDLRRLNVPILRKPFKDEPELALLPGRYRRSGDGLRIHVGFACADKLHGYKVADRRGAVCRSEAHLYGRTGYGTLSGIGDGPIHIGDFATRPAGGLRQGDTGEHKPTGIRIERLHGVWVRSLAMCRHSQCHKNSDEDRRSCAEYSARNPLPFWLLCAQQCQCASHPLIASLQPDYH